MKTNNIETIIVEKDYFNKEDIEIHFKEKVVIPEEIKETIIVYRLGTILSTIEFLKDKKIKLVKEIDEEIEENQRIIDNVSEKVKKIVFSIPEEEVMN